MKPQVQRIRDLTIVRREGGRLLVIGCDSSASIGNKPMDAVQTPPAVAGYYAARVAVMEVLSVGAEILTVIDTLAVEKEPTGNEIIRGIRKLLEEAGLTAAHVNGSTEDNFVTCQTGIGITVIGEADETQLKLGCSQGGDCIVMLGEPLVGSAVLEQEASQCTIRQLQLLAAAPEVHDIHPVGSRGARYEAELLAELNSCGFRPVPGIADKLQVSGGPATAVIFAAKERRIRELQSRIGGKMEIIGYLQD
ncbi:AIR synthase related protein [Paenibacillus sp. FSL P4-0338]|uniref:AIR synthase related protein n=1 Tax=Paenibacillus sp. FSL P4-0338 TaxID=2921635 RepID=UPI0030F8FAA1